MHIDHVHKTKTDPYLPNKHTLAEVVMTYTIKAADINPDNLAPIVIAIEDLKTIEGFFVQYRHSDGGDVGRVDLGVDARASGNNLTIRGLVGNVTWHLGAMLDICAFGKP